MKPASLSNAILSFFSWHGLYLYPTKYCCSTKPASPFLYICCNFGQIFCTNVIYFSSVQNLGHNQPQNYSKYHLVSLLDEKQRSTFDIFVPFFTPLDALTNSAMEAGGWVSQNIKRCGHQVRYSGNMQSNEPVGSTLLTTCCMPGKQTNNCHRQASCQQSGWLALNHWHHPHPNHKSWRLWQGQWGILYRCHILILRKIQYTKKSEPRVRLQLTAKIQP